MARNLFLGALAVMGMAVTTSPAHAQYTVYIWNMNRNDGWFRSGLARDVYKSKAACLQSIKDRVAENKRYRTDWEAFAVVYTNQRPAYGYLNRSNVPGGWNLKVRYIPGRGFFSVKVESIGGLPAAKTMLARTRPIVSEGRRWDEWLTAGSTGAA